LVGSGVGGGGGAAEGWVQRQHANFWCHLVGWARAYVPGARRVLVAGHVELRLGMGTLWLERVRGLPYPERPRDHDGSFSSRRPAHHTPQPETLPLTGHPSTLLAY
jgi:hypothetical protein